MIVLDVMVEVVVETAAGREVAVIAAYVVVILRACACFFFIPLVRCSNFVFNSCKNAFIG